MLACRHFNTIETQSSFRPQPSPRVGNPWDHDPVISFCHPPLPFKSQRMRPVPWLSGCLAAVLVLASVEQVRSQVLPTPVDEAESVEAGLISIESDSQSADNVTGVVTELGNVRITYPSRRMVATSRQAQYFT